MPFNNNFVNLMADYVYDTTEHEEFLNFNTHDQITNKDILMYILYMNLRRTNINFGEGCLH